MSQKDYDAFKEQLKQWMVDNPDKYSEFEEMMDKMPFDGHCKMMNEATRLLPTFRQLIKKARKGDGSIELGEIIEEATKRRVAEKILVRMHRRDSGVFITSLLVWIYHGRAWEGMVEQGEAIMARPKISTMQRIFISLAIKMVIRASIKHKFRTKEDWDRYNKLRKAIEAGDTLGWAIEDAPETEDIQEQDSAQRAPTKFKTFVNAKPASMIYYLSDRLDEDQKQELLKRINLYLNDHAVNISRFVATMFYVLEEYKYLKSYVKGDIYKIIRNEFCPNIGSDSLINNYLNPNNEVKNLRNDELERARSIFFIV